jgi:hypothetical protein
MEIAKLIANNHSVKIHVTIRHGLLCGKQKKSLRQKEE